MKEKNATFRADGVSYLLPLGVGFVMASSADVRAALGMGCAVLLVLLCSSVVIALLKNLIPQRGHIAAYLLVVTGFVSLTQMVMEAYFHNVFNMLGVHLACLAVTAVPFCDAGTFAGKQSLGKTVRDALTAGVYALVIMLVCAVFREVFGSARIFGVEIPFLSDYRIPTLAGVFGGYMVLSFVLAAAAAIRNRGAGKKTEKEASV